MGLVEPAGDAGCGGVDLVDPAPFGLFAFALGGEAFEGADGHGVFDQRVGGLADQDVAGGGGLLEAFGEHDGLAGDEGMAAARVAGDDLAGVDADPDLQVDAVAVVQVLVELVEAFVHVGSAADGAQGVVLVHMGDAEHGHDLVADELLHGAAVRSTAACICSKYRDITCRNASGSIPSASPVECTTSQNNTVTVFRESRPERVPTGRVSALDAEGDVDGRAVLVDPVVLDDGAHRHDLCALDVPSRSSTLHGLRRRPPWRSSLVTSRSRG